MAKKHLRENLQTGLYEEIGKSTYRAKPKPYVEAAWIGEYRRQRDREIYKTSDEETRKELIEFYKLKDGR